MNTIKKLLGLLDQQMKNVNFVSFKHLKLSHDDQKKFFPSEQHKTKKSDLKRHGHSQGLEYFIPNPLRKFPRIALPPL